VHAAGELEQERVVEAVSHPDRERAVLRGRFDLGEVERTLSGPGGTLGISAERVRQIEQAALGTLREHSVHGGPG
jgi:DNA-directed RNA polymerase sigma subunit (sigma70/sigma32)